MLAGRWSPAPSLGAARERWSSDADRLDATLAALEERLLADQARVNLWEELRARHETVTQVACQNLDEHARSIAAVQERDRDQARTSRRSRLASAETHGSTRAP